MSQTSNRPEKTPKRVFFPDTLEGIDVPAGLARLGGNEKLFQELLIDFAARFPGLIRVIREAIEKKDRKRVQDTVHMIKGTAGNLSATQVFQAALALENKIKLGKMWDCTHCLAELEEALTCVERSVKELEKEEVGNPGSETDLQQAQALITRLSKMIDEANLETENCLNMLKGCLNHDRFGHQLKDLSACISNFDFVAARQPLDLLVKDLGIVLNGQTNG